VSKSYMQRWPRELYFSRNKVDLSFIRCWYKWSFGLKWVRDLQLHDMDSKTVVDNIYGRRNSISDFGVIINNCRRLL